MVSGDSSQGPVLTRRRSTAVPYVGELEGKPGCFICAGHNGHGEFTPCCWTIE